MTGSIPVPRSRGEAVGRLLPLIPRHARPGSRSLALRRAAPAAPAGSAKRKPTGRPSGGAPAAATIRTQRATDTRRLEQTGTLGK